MIGTLQGWAINNQRKLVPAGSLRARFALGAFWSVAGTLVSRGFFLASSVLCARFLGKAGFGALGMIQSTAGMFGTFAGLGLGLTATKYVGEYRQSDPAKVGRILALSAAAAAVSGVVMAVVLASLAGYLSRTILAAPKLAQPLAIGAGLVLFGAVNGAQTGALAGFEAFKTIAVLNVCVGIASFPLVAIGVWNHGLTGAVSGLVAALVVNWALNSCALRSECARSGISYDFVTCHGELHILLEFSLPALLASIIVGPALWACTALMVRHPDGYAQLGLYTAADKWRLMILFVPTCVSTVALPILSNLYGARDHCAFRKVFRANALLDTGITFVAGVVIAVFAVPIMALYGVSFSAGWPILIVLCFAAVPEGLNTILGQPLIAGQYMWWRFAFDVLLVAVLLGLGWLLIPKWNALGLAVAYGGSFASACVGLYVFARARFWRSPNRDVLMGDPSERARPF